MTFIPPITGGTTLNRPAAVPVGFEYFDTDLGYPVYWDGAGWVEAAPPAPQTATVAFNAASLNVDHTAPSPFTINGALKVTTSDLAVTEEDITVEISDLGTGSAVDPGQYASGPYSVVIPAGTAHNATINWNFAHVADPAEVPEIPPDVDVDVEITNLTSVQATAIGAQATATVNLQAGGGA